MDPDAIFRFVQELAADLSKGPIVFPTAFDTTLRIRDLLRDEDASTLDIAKLVQTDPLLSSRVLHTANSAALNRSGNPIRDVKAAVALMGIANVRVMALSIAMQQLRTYKEMARFETLCNRYMLHSRYVAAVACILAREHTKVPPETAYFTGLVHDIGLFYLLYRIAERTDLFPNPDEVPGLLYDWHASIGHALLSALDTPEEILRAIETHEESRRIEVMRGLGDLLQVANLIASRIGPEDARMGAPFDTQRREDVILFDEYLATAETHYDEIERLSKLI